MTQADYHEILLNVRRSYRIAASFQQRMFYVLNQIEAAFPELVYNRWDPVFTARPPQPTTKVTRKWTWDFLPLLASDHWFTLAGTTRDDPLKEGDWFMTVRILADDGFDADVGTSASFNGPDPDKMPSPEEAQSEIYVVAWRLRKAGSEAVSAADVWHGDETENDEELRWYDAGDTGGQSLYAGGSLAELLQDGAMESLIAGFRAKLAESGLELVAAPAT